MFERRTSVIKLFLREKTVLGRQASRRFLWPDSHGEDDWNDRK
jgi:hypothetical protein